MQHLAPRETLPAPPSYEIDFCSPSTEHRTEPAPPMEDDLDELDDFGGPVHTTGMPISKRHESHGIPVRNTLNGSEPHDDRILRTGGAPRYKTSEGHTTYNPPSARIHESVDVASRGVETQILYKILARIDGGPWSSDLVGRTPDAATFASKAQLEGVLKWLRGLAANNPDGPKIEYTAVPILLTARNLW